MEEYMLPCLNKQLFGLDCLGCGAQRAFFLLIKGEFGAAFHMYPAIYTILLLLLFLLANLFIKFKYAWPIKISLITVSTLVIIGSYFYKMGQFYN